MSSKTYVAMCDCYEIKWGIKKEVTKEITFVENEKADDLTKEIIKNSFLAGEMLVLQSVYLSHIDDLRTELCKKLDEMFPQAIFEHESRDIFDFDITATIKPYENLSKKQIEKIAEITNSSLYHFENGQKAIFSFDKDCFFEDVYNGASEDTLLKVIKKYGLEELIE